MQGIDKAQRVDQRVGFETEITQCVVDVGRKTRALCNDVEDPKFSGDPRVLELEARSEVDDTIVPLELALVVIDGNRHGGRKEGLARRRDLEDGAGANRLAAALASYAKTLCVNELVAGDDSDGEARHVVSPHSLRDIGFQIGDDRSDTGLIVGFSGECR